MIQESWYWKQPLLEAADRLEALKDATELSEETLAQAERDVMVGFYSVRKLFEAVAKVTDSVKDVTLGLAWFPCTSPVSWRNSHRIDEIYQLADRREEVRGAIFVCGRIVHSYVFVHCENERGGLDGFFFNSDRDKDSRLYLIQIDEVVALFRRVGLDDVREIRWQLADASGAEVLTAR